MNYNLLATTYSYTLIFNPYKPKIMKKSILLFTMLLISVFSFAKGQHHSRRSSGHSRSHNGRFIGGHGSSHRGGQYHSRKGNGDHYSRRKH
jgi:hypothetical protein